MLTPLYFYKMVMEMLKYVCVGVGENPFLSSLDTVFQLYTILLREVRCKWEEERMSNIDDIYDAVGTFISIKAIFYICKLHIHSACHLTVFDISFLIYSTSYENMLRELKRICGESSERKITERNSWLNFFLCFY